MKNRTKRICEKAALARGLAMLAAACFFSISTWAQLDSGCVVSILNRTVPVNPDGSWVLPNVPANFGLVRARASCVHNGITTFGQSDLFSLSTNQILNLPVIHMGTTTPIPTAIVVTSPSNVLTAAGQTVQLSVMASYATGPAQDVTAGASGTAYNVSNPAIATVSADGLVTAVSSGTVVIQAVNEGRQGIVILQVALAGASHGGIPDSWAVAHGLDTNDPSMPMEDPDHDGLTNLQEFLAGTDPNNPDTDGDGLTDGQEVLIYHTNPALFSTDGSGISDGIEVQTNTLGDSLQAKLAAAIQTFSITPNHFVLNVNTIQGIASQQLGVNALLIDGKTTVDLTSTATGTTYGSSDLTICNFGFPDGNIFAGNAGGCTITASNAGFTAQSLGTVTTFSPTAMGFVSIPGFANEVAVNGNYAYVAAGSAGLQVVNVGNRNAPSVVASLALQGNANDIKLLGNLAYIASGSAGLQVVDVTNPLAPVLRGSFGAAGNALTSVVRGTTAYIANGPSLLVVDVTNPASMSLLGTLNIPGANLLGMDVDSTRNLLVATSGPNGIYTVDVSNPASPVLLGNVSTGDARAAAIKGNYVFIADYNNSTTAVDISNLSAPVVVSNITDPNLGGFLQDIALSGTFALAADVKFVNGIPITDISAPTSLQARAILNFPQRDDNGMGIAVDGAYVYLTTEHNTLDKFGATGDSRLYIGQYLALVDNKGIPPTAAITSPLPGATLIEGATVPIIVNATDDVAVAAVNFLVNGQVVFTSTAPPYQYNFVVPTGVTSVTLGANAVDLGGNVGTAPPVTVNVIPDPGTTVVGTVVDTSQNPVAGATVSAPGGLTATSAADGTFSISGVPTIGGSVIVTASLTQNGQLLGGSSAAFPAVRGGTTNVGTIVISPAVFNTSYGTLVAVCDDCSVQETLPFPFTYFGTTYTSLYVNNNGNITFANGDPTYTPTISGFVNQPRIGVFWDDLISNGGPAGEGLYVNNTIPGEFVVTWLHQQIYCCTGDDTIQFTLFSDGRFQFAYNGITTITGSTSQSVIIGVTPGGNAPLAQVDYTSDPSITITGLGSILEQYTASNPFSIDGSFILFAPNASGGYDVQLVTPPPPPQNATLVQGRVHKAAAAPNSSTGFTLQGHAYDAQGNPLAGAAVTVTSSLAMSFKGTATTDANGEYTISGVPYGGIGVTASLGSTSAVAGAVVSSGSTATIDVRPLPPPAKTAPQNAAKSPGTNHGAATSTPIVRH